MVLEHKFIIKIIVKNTDTCYTERREMSGRRNTKRQKTAVPGKTRQGGIRQNSTEAEKSAVAYQNKDITGKFLAENFKGKTFNVYGLNLPRVESVLPTNIPTIQANELRLDNLFELADNTVALVDYESDYAD